MTDLDALEYRRVLSRFATGVAVVGTKHVGGGVCGLTVNAFTSVSLLPPLIMVSLDRTSNTYACIEAKGFFTTSFLSEGQHELAVRFAERRDDKFRDVAYRLVGNGAPIVEGSIAHLGCAVEAEDPGGDHQLLLARVTAGATTGGAPLVSFGSRYTTVQAGTDEGGGAVTHLRSAESDLSLQEELAGEFEDG
jgi:flavin reductase (DIM6/NTAB) family NADH-FMN oxidoreductase RutF